MPVNSYYYADKNDKIINCSKVKSDKGIHCVQWFGDNKGSLHKTLLGTIAVTIPIKQACS